MTRNIPSSAAAPLCALALASGCAPPIVGEWTTPEELSYYLNGTVEAPNRMTIGSDGTGKADVYYVLVDAAEQLVYRDRFEIAWQEEGESDFVLDLTCFDSEAVGASCGEHDFTMSCSTAGEGDGQAATAECSGDQLWADYAFAWEAVPDEE